PIADGAPLRLHVSKAAVRDFFDHPATADVDESLAWTGSGTSVLADTSAPTVRAVCLIDKKLVVDWSEPVAASRVDSQLTLDGSATDWTVDAFGYSVELSSPLAAGNYLLNIGGGPLDLAGTAAEPAGPFAFTVGAGPDPPTIFEAEPPDRVAASTVGNVFGFHGLPHDPETGLIYARHRMLDPELGRFITKDPLGYVDGPSAYAFAGNSPVDFTDPLGLYLGATNEELAAAHGALTPEQKEQFAQAQTASFTVAGYVGLGAVAAAGSPVIAGAGFLGLWALNADSRYDEIAATEANPSFANAAALGFYDLTPVSPALELYYGHSLGSGEELGTFGQGMNVLGVVPALSATARTARRVGRGLPSSREIVIYGFRNTPDRAVRDRFAQANFGHVGLSFDRGRTVLGFGPIKPAGMSGEEFMDAIRRRDSFLGALTDDTRIFERARYYDLNVEEFKYNVGTFKFWLSRSRAWVDQLHSPMSNKLYSFPERGGGGFGPCQYNCATYPTSIGLETPIPSGLLSDVLKRQPTRRPVSSGSSR
ncbi:MAG: RHS repeat-associated core domain-containing protein, partial [Acidobacteriota bacterium]